MALQPATGARDLNPREVESNRRICDLLAEMYRLWGYQEVAPPTIERLATLGAGGAIAEREVIRLVAEEPLGLRPELTASIARAASTRMVDRPAPCGSGPAAPPLAASSPMVAASASANGFRAAWNCSGPSPPPPTAN
jgi:histidyl-tRNA synthetase